MDQEARLINVVVIGEKNSGKTSIISSLYEFASSDHKPSHWYKSTNIECLLGNNVDDWATIQSYTRDSHNDYVRRKRHTHALMNTREFCRYRYTIRVYSTEFNLNILDTPALSELEQGGKDMLSRYLRESDIVIVAVDTPAIMESHGCTAQVKKQADDCANMLLGHIQNSSKHRLVLFVPTRCEKYYCAGKLWEVADKVQMLYHRFFAAYYCLNQIREKKAKEEKYMSAKKFAIISPLLTMGNVFFDLYENYRQLDSAEFDMGDSYVFYPEFADKIFTGIANFLILQGFCKTETLDLYTEEDKQKAISHLPSNLFRSLSEGGLKKLRESMDPLVRTGKWREINIKELFDSDFEYGYREYYT